MARPPSGHAPVGNGARRRRATGVGRGHRPAGTSAGPFQVAAQRATLQSTRSAEQTRRRPGSVLAGRTVPESLPAVGMGGFERTPYSLTRERGPNIHGPGGDSVLAAEDFHAVTRGPCIDERRRLPGRPHFLWFSAFAG